MTGLQIEINKRKFKKSPAGEKFSISYIYRLLGTYYLDVQRKLEDNKFTTTESLAIFHSLIPQEKQSLEMYEYLFTEQN